jgi:hypothetical protein
MVAVSKESPMYRRRSWVAVACGLVLVLGLVVGLAAQGCETNVTSHLCPDSKTGIYDPDCCVLYGEGCEAPCVVPGSNLGLCQDLYCATCPGEAATTPGSNCLEWAKEYCGQDAGTDMDGATGCAGDCVPLPPAGWDGPYLLQTNPAGTVPECPSNAPVPAYTGFADPGEQPDAGCTECACDRSNGSCAPPASIFASALRCDAGTLFGAPFDPPGGWDGGCTTSDAVAAGAACNGSPCVASIVAGPVGVMDDGCTPSKTAPVDAGPPGFETSVVACTGSTSPAITCGDPHLTCTPSAPPSSGFLTCIFQEGDNPCPAGSPYSEQHVVYAGFDDQRGCTPCGCGPPGSSCTATLAVFGDDMCTAGLINAGISSAGASCFDLQAAGLPLGSKEVVGAKYNYGSCAPSGGDPTGGGFVPSGAATFCCIP